MSVVLHVMDWQRVGRIGLPRCSVENLIWLTIGIRVPTILLRCPTQDLDMKVLHGGHQALHSSVSSAGRNNTLLW